MEPNAGSQFTTRPFIDNPSATIQHHLNWVKRREATPIPTDPFSEIQERVAIFDGHPTTRYHIALSKTRLLLYVESDLDPVVYPEPNRLFCVWLYRNNELELIGQWIDRRFKRVCVDFVKFPFSKLYDRSEQKTTVGNCVRFLLKYIERDYSVKYFDALNYYNDIETKFDSLEVRKGQTETIALWPLPHCLTLRPLLLEPTFPNQPSTSTNRSDYIFYNEYQEILTGPVNVVARTCVQHLLASSTNQPTVAQQTTASTSWNLIQSNNNSTSAESNLSISNANLYLTSISNAETQVVPLDLSMKKSSGPRN